MDTRDMTNMDTHSRPDRPLDIVVWGATGFTGQLVAEYLVRSYLADGLRLAIAGRNPEGLEALRGALSDIQPAASEIPILTGDSLDRPSLDKIAAQASVVCTTVGPYLKLGEDLVAACAANGTHYCDLAGEIPFIRRMIDRHNDSAARSSARIVHACGFDSVPSDLGVLMMQEAARSRHGVPCQDVKLFVTDISGGFSGGTIASMFNLIEEAGRDPWVRQIIGDRYALNPEGQRDGPDDPNQRGVRFDVETGMWTGPFIMAAINTRVVRMTNALSDFAYGRDFRYSEVMGFEGRVAGWLKAAGVAAGVGGFLALASVRPTRELMAETLLPSPGEGPSRKKRESGFFRILLVGKARPTGNAVTLRGRVEGNEDPGYNETAKMLAESAVCLARDALASEGGVHTPASAMGMRLVERLRQAGIVFEVD